MPSSSSFCAMMSLSSTEKETASPCVPSRRVVSNVEIFMGVSGGGWYSGFLFLFEERHHFAQLAAHRFDGGSAGGVAHGEETVTSGFVLVDPLAGELARLDFGKDLFHFGPRLFVDDARAARVVPILGGVGNGVAHVAEAAFIDKVDDQLELVEALEIG